MSNTDLKTQIQQAISAFAQGDLTTSALNLFQVLGYDTGRQAPLTQKNFEEFKEDYIDQDKNFNEEKALCSDWTYVDLLFQLSKEEISRQNSLFDTKQVDNTIIETYLFFTIELSRKSYTRTALSNITREVNKLFPMPVMILFKHGNTLTLSVINRRLHKRDASRDVLEKVTLIKDINIEKHNRAHTEILFDLSFDELLRKHSFTNFVELHNAWQKTLDIQELNKRFFKDLANWYFWAMNHIKFPDDVEKNDEIRNATNLIRLITRIIFIWFIKEKGLVPDTLFSQAFIARILKDFDKNTSTHNYYNAILQNLFFGTLNQKSEERRFAAEGDIETNKNEYGVKNLFRYAHLFKISKDEVLQIFKDIPFLNGGLFDCLDKEDENGKVQYVDGFSRNTKKMAILPDFLFFSEEQQVYLPAFYDPKAKKRTTYTVKGLIKLLENYKFTVTENTPVEEEIALDPELLGKVFENLLASYNPETKTTARKQTGSFYTPREIVNYMVDESLIAYLKQKLDDTKETEDKLRELLSYSEKEPEFSKQEQEKLIEAIDHIKILDPACGSGAFPMGVLHKMVHVLQKLDPDNKHWRELQRKKAVAETEEAFKIGEKEARAQRLEEINDVFENNASDYGRKLYLIENCIYGIDIQPIAVQIAKLRFFISLVIDQKVDPAKENFGIRSLPNLETKFVAANTLIGLEVPTTNLFTENDPLKKLENALKEVRHQYFSAKTRREKIRLQKKDNALRKKIATEVSATLVQKNEEKIRALEENLQRAEKKLQEMTAGKEEKESITSTNLFGERETKVIDKKKEKIKTEKARITELKKQIKTLQDQNNKAAIQKVAEQIASFDPYDQNHFANWFDPEWMFGLNQGFDIVIGNPPYLRIQGVQETTPELVAYAKKNYESAHKGNWDLYILFNEAGYKFLKPNGILAYIQPHKFFQSDFGIGIRNYFAEEKCLYKIVSFGEEQMFDSASNYTCLFFIQKKIQKQFKYMVVENPRLWLEDTSKTFFHDLPQPKNNQKWNFTSKEKYAILQKLYQNEKKLEDVTKKIFQGIPTGSDKVFVLTFISTVSNNKLLCYSKSMDKEIVIEKEFVRPFLMGKDVKRYEKPETINYVIFPYKKSNGKYVLYQENEIINLFPLAWKYLSENHEALKERENYRFEETWWQFSRPQNLLEFETIKILTPEIAIRPQLTIDTNGNCFHTTKVYSFLFNDSRDENIKYYLGLLNSKVLWFFLSQTGYVLRGGYYF